ncbi:holo-ACP synthase [Amphibacillus cookii]|uniref:holo-ACP synthase n=1 Tax=Amphibacillus cookii TaxID=767787 RepID=UPI0030844550|nr:holo-[acyl-carrier protein] synthase [Amphibacillus cookii]
MKKGDMMIVGTGIDIIELERMRALIERNPRIVEKILTLDEQLIYKQKLTRSQQCEFLAGRFAGKEAFVKAYGTGIGKVRFHDLSILPEVNGQPKILFKQPHHFKSHISISHSQAYAVAQVILET